MWVIWEFVCHKFILPRKWPKPRYFLTCYICDILRNSRLASTDQSRLVRVMVGTGQDCILSHDWPVPITVTQTCSRPGRSRLITIIETQTLSILYSYQKNHFFVYIRNIIFLSHKPPTEEHSFLLFICAFLVSTYMCFKASKLW